jgi:predicted RNase H-like nuclease (RuvC/YqgF family)
MHISSDLEKEFLEEEVTRLQNENRKLTIKLLEVKAELKMLKEEVKHECNCHRR